MIQQNQQGLALPKSQRHGPCIVHCLQLPTQCLAHRDAQEMSVD